MTDTPSHPPREVSQAEFDRIVAILCEAALNYLRTQPVTEDDKGATLRDTPKEDEK